MKDWVVFASVELGDVHRQFHFWALRRVGPRLLFSGGRRTIFSGGWGVNSRERGKTKKKDFFSWATVKRTPYIFSAVLQYSRFAIVIFSFQFSAVSKRTLTIVWVMLKLRLLLKVELFEMIIKMKSTTYLMLILIWIMICRIHNNCPKCCVFVLKLYACLSRNCFVLILNLIWILMWSFVVLS